MTHSFDEIIRLDSERTQGAWKIDNISNAIRILGHASVHIGHLCKTAPADAKEFEANAQYIAAMPDAVGLLKKYHDGIESVLNDLIICNRNPERSIENAINELTALLEEPKP